MTTLPRSSREIDGQGRTIRELFAGCTYSIDGYQREYNWQKADLGARQNLYRLLAERIWNADRWERGATS